MALTPKNWTSFQHYKDRAPAWIKLHRAILDNHDFYCLSDAAGKMLPQLWLIASERDGILPEPEEISFRLRVSTDKVLKCLAEMIEYEFLIEADTQIDGAAEQGATLSQRLAAKNGFGSRYISDTLKQEIWTRDGGKCQECGSLEDLEYDHKVPVSKGGNSVEDNIQLLCRPCNRRKRVRLATRALDRRSLEKRREEIQEEKRENLLVKSVKALSTGFETWWQAYPRKIAKGSARKAYIRALKDPAITEAMLLSSAQRYADHRNGEDPQYTKHPATWLNANCWNDEPDGVFNGKRSLTAVGKSLQGVEYEIPPRPRLFEETGDAAVRLLPKG